MPEFQLSDKQSIVWNRLNDPDSPIEEIFFAGGAGAGKSLLISAFQGLRRIMYPDTVGFVARYSATDLRDTTMRTFERWWAEYGQFNPIGVTMEIKGSPPNAVFSNGSIIMFRHLKPREADAHNFGSLELTDLCIDEMPECDESAVKILMSRIRHKLIAGKRAILCAGNPSDNWVMKRYVQDDNSVSVILPKNMMFVPATLDDNPDEQFREQYEKSLEYLDEYDRNRLRHGIWGGRRENDSPFFWNHDRIKIIPNHIKPDQDLWLSFDFNYDPTTVLICQAVWGEGIFISKEILQKGGTAALCDRIIDEGLDQHDAPIFVTGDSSGSKANTAAGKEPGGRHLSDYLIIEKKLILSRNQFKGTQGSNASLVFSAKLVNYALQKIPVYIDPSCRELIKDLRTAVRAPDGGLVKDRKAHKQDAGDAFRYFIHALFPFGTKDVDKFADLI